MTSARRQAPYRLQVVLSAPQREALRRLKYFERKTTRQLFAEFLQEKATHYPEVAEALASAEERRPR